MTMVFEPVSTGPWLTIPAGATNLPVAKSPAFSLWGRRSASMLAAIYEVATVTAVGKAATQSTLFCRGGRGIVPHPSGGQREHPGRRHLDGGHGRA